MTPTWWALAGCAVALGAVGHLTGRELATGGYRIVEDEAVGPPGRVWWTGPLTAALTVVAVLAVLARTGEWAAVPAFLLLAWLTTGLVWIDLDVHRLPVGLVVPTGAALLVLLVPASLATADGRWLGALVGALVMGGVYLLLGIVPGGGVGGGDVRLAPVLGALLGWLGADVLVVGLASGFLVGGVAAAALLALRRVGLRSHIAYGPAMCLGAWVGVGAGDRILTALLAG
ncbi:prepilin peptidase [Phycicoccus sp. BSK3Z-2]|uniref:Prepilin peptidase n=1 Tax=Phycicoccus avicenniae TaxID=2828860 RepID=A0A941HYQ8_9MICO|nr:prepilin peptidase [Phycicoccus avicenniae]MBR7742115.1 prepilin peptidase [Phycicoccus avicenniae]